MALTGPFQSRAFRFVWASQLANVVGDAMFGVAFALFVIRRFGSAEVVGLLLGSVAVGGITALLIGGALADRHRRTRMVVASDVIRLVGLGGLIVVAEFGSAIALIFPALVLGVGGGLYRPAFGAILPSIVDPEHLKQANAIRALTNRLAFVLGGAVGGILVDLTSPTMVMMLDSATFLVSIGAMLVLREKPLKIRNSDHSIFVDISQGISYVRSIPWIAAVMLQGTVQIAVVSSAAIVVLPLVFGTGSGSAFGFIVALEAAGAMVGATVGSRVGSRRQGLVAMMALLLQVPQLVSIWSGAGALQVAILSGLAGFGLSVFAIVWTSALQRQVPERWLGRVMSLDALTATGLAPIGLAAAGYALGAFGVGPVMAIGIVVLVGSVAATVFVPGVAEFGNSVLAPSPSAKWRWSGDGG